MITAIYLFVLGLTFGSFALVVADRSIRKKDWVKGRSSCDFCHKKLAVIDLVPLVSWLSTGGKCRYCHKKLSAMYPLVELTLAIAFVGSYLAIQQNLSGTIDYVQLGLWLSGLVLMIILLIIDAKTMLMPYKFLFPLIGIAGVYAAIELVRAPFFSTGVLDLVLSLAVGAGVFAILYLVSRGKWIGDSDVLFGIVIGLFLSKPLESWLAIILASMAGLIFGVLAATVKKKSVRHTKIPFGPFLIIGLYFSFLFGAKIIAWYTETVLFM